MNPPEKSDNDRERRLDEVVAAWVKAREAGGKPDVREWLARHPDLAPELESFFAAEKQLGEIAAPWREAATLNTPPAVNDIETETIDHVGNLRRPAPAAGGEQGVPGLGRTIGEYELIAEIARGGMGVVYKARQTRLNRTVALKMILAGEFANQDDVRRFLAEAEAAAGLDHPGIVPVYESGEIGGQHFFSMGYINGRSLAALLAAGPLPPRRAAELLVQVADAVDYAHRQGVIHRDLKPGNILLDQDENPRVTDFGLAKRIAGGSELTRTGQALGTPSYMPPEQASGKLDAIGPVSDVYALGAVLYAMLTGRPPFQAASPLDTLLQVLEEEPVAPRQLNADVPVDLETIALKCLEKEPHKRYATAGELADELRRFLLGEPIHARPIGSAERAWRWCRRNPLVAGLAATAAMALVAGAGVSTHFAVEAYHRARDAESSAVAARMAEAGEKREKLAALAAAKEAQAQKADAIAARNKESLQLEAASWNLYLAHMHLARQAWEGGDLARARELLQLHLPLGAGIDQRGWEWKYLDSHCRGLVTLRGHKTSIFAAAWSHDGRRLASAGGSATPFDPSNEWRIWDTATGQMLRLNAGHDGGLRRVAWSPDGARLATGGQTGFQQPGILKIWDAQNGKLLFELKGLTRSVDAVAFSPDGRRLASGGGAFDFGKRRGGEVRLWDAFTGEQTLALKGLTDGVFAVSWSPDGRQLATAGNSGTVKIWNAATGTLAKKLTGHRLAVYSADWSPDGQKIASTSADPSLKVWDVATETELATAPITGIGCCWRTDGKRLAVAFSDGSLRDFDPATGKDMERIESHITQAGAAILSPDEQRVAFICGDQTIKLWDVRQVPPCIVLEGPAERINSLRWSSDGEYLATAGSGIQIWNSATGQKMKSLGFPEGTAVFSLDWSPDGKRLFSASTQPLGATLKIWSATGEETQSWVGSFLPALAAAWSPDGRWLGAASDQGSITIWDQFSEKAPPSPKTAKPPSDRPKAAAEERSYTPPDAAQRRLPRASPPRLATTGAKASWSPDGKRLVVTAPGAQRGLLLVDLAGGKQTRITQSGKDPAFSPTDDKIAYVCNDGQQEEIWLVTSSGENPHKVADGGFPSWSADGKMLYYHSRSDWNVKAIAPDSARPAANLTVVNASWYPAVSPDGSKVAYLAAGDLVIVDGRTGRRETHTVKAAGGFVAWSADSRQIAYGDYGGNNGEGLWLLDLDTNGRAQLAPAGYTMPAWSPDGKRVACDLRDGSQPTKVFVIDLDN